jgi:hypothetical protein
MGTRMRIGRRRRRGTDSRGRNGFGGLLYHAMGRSLNMEHKSRDGEDNDFFLVSDAENMDWNERYSVLLEARVDSILSSFRGLSLGLLDIPVSSFSISSFPLSTMASSSSLCNESSPASLP